MPSHIPISLASLPNPNPVGSRPDVPLPVLAQVAIYESPNNRLTLKEIYAAIQDRYEYYREVQTDAWKRSMRHALSLHQVFRHIDRPVQEAGKGGYWTLDYSQGEGTKRERKRRPLPQGDDDDDDGEGGRDTEAEGYRSEYQYPPSYPSGCYSDYGSAHSHYDPPQLQHHGQQYAPHHSETYPGHYSAPPTYHSPYAGPCQSQSRSSANLYVDTVARIKQESSPSPMSSPSSYSSHSSDSTPPVMSPTLGTTPTLRRRRTMPVLAFGWPPYPLPGLATSSYGPLSASAPGPSGYAQTGYGPPPTAAGSSPAPVAPTRVIRASKIQDRTSNRRRRKGARGQDHGRDTRDERSSRPLGLGIQCLKADRRVPLQAFPVPRTIGRQPSLLRTSDTHSTTKTQTNASTKPKSMVLPDPLRLAGSTASEVLHFEQANDLLKSPGSSMARVSSTPATTTPTPASTDDPKIVETSYGRTPVYEMTCHGIAVMKRRSYAWLNANQILKVAGSNTLQTREIMEREVWGGEHEMLKRGGGTFQGTCIPLARAVASCEKYHCEAQLRPLLHFEKQDEWVLENTSEERVEATKSTLSLSTEQLQAQPSDHELFLSSPSSNPPEPAYDDPLDRLLTRADGIHRVHRHRRCLTVSSRPRCTKSANEKRRGRWRRMATCRCSSRRSANGGDGGSRTVLVPLVQDQDDHEDLSSDIAGNRCARTPQPSPVEIELELEQHEDTASPCRGDGGLRDALNNAWAQNADALEDAARKGMEERRVKSKSHRMRSAAASMVSASSSASAFGDQDGTTKSGGRERNRATIITTDEEGSRGRSIPVHLNTDIISNHFTHTASNSKRPPRWRSRAGSRAGMTRCGRGHGAFGPIVQSRSQSPQATSAPSPRVVSPPAQDGFTVLASVAMQDQENQDQAQPEPVQTILISAAGSRTSFPSCSTSPSSSCGPAKPSEYNSTVRSTTRRRTSRRWRVHGTSRMPGAKSNTSSPTRPAPSRRTPWPSASARSGASATPAQATSPRYLPPSQAPAPTAHRRAGPLSNGLRTLTVAYKEVFQEDEYDVRNQRYHDTMVTLDEQTFEDVSDEIDDDLHRAAFLEKLDDRVVRSEDDEGGAWELEVHGVTMRPVVTSSASLLHGAKLASGCSVGHRSRRVAESDGTGQSQRILLPFGSLSSWSEVLLRISRAQPPRFACIPTVSSHVSALQATTSP
uniref:Winged helix DNA-binding domain-containing protein n=1 Tax=Mycena chlorophos TaxID=658473 RepID=A0ABQ0MDH4_MYCCL|nr:winged helix DNA-binding domain-containing protein [Mycena chlorophos]